jgi:hypothetical protein
MLFFKSSVYDYVILGINFPEFVAVWKNYKQGIKSKKGGKV